jgi:hypothetical protein
MYYVPLYYYELKKYILKKYELRIGTYIGFQIIHRARI